LFRTNWPFSVPPSPRCPILPKFGFVWQDEPRQEHRQPVRPTAVAIRAEIGFVFPGPCACPIYHNSLPARCLPLLPPWEKLALFVQEPHGPGTPGIGFVCTTAYRPQTAGYPHLALFRMHVSSFCLQIVNRQSQIQGSAPDQSVPLSRGRVARIVPEFCTRTRPLDRATLYVQRNKEFLPCGAFCLFNCCTNVVRAIRCFYVPSCRISPAWSEGRTVGANDHSPNHTRGGRKTEGRGRRTEDGDQAISRGRATPIINLVTPGCDRGHQ